jgi:hypothetical protein
MPLQFFDDVANETHGDRLAANGKIAKSFCESHVCLRASQFLAGLNVV